MVALGLDLARHVVLDVSMKREGLYDHGNCYRLRSFEAFVPELTITFDCVVTIALAFMVLVTAVVEDFEISQMPCGPHFCAAIAVEVMIAITDAKRCPRLFCALQLSANMWCWC